MSTSISDPIRDRNATECSSIQEPIGVLKRCSASIIISAVLILQIAVGTSVHAEPTHPEQGTGSSQQKESGQIHPPDRQQDGSAFENDESPLSVNEPMYFVIGGDSDVKARFQFSFQYDLFDQNNFIVRKAGWTEGLKFGYTQTSLWNLTEESAPFEDSSYRPSLFWDAYTKVPPYLPGYIRMGYEHESNGRGGLDSRSIDTVYVWPFWGGTVLGQEWSVGPKIYSYIGRDDNNRDIDDYRGYVDLWARLGNDASWLLSGFMRQGRSDRRSFQLEVSYPIRQRLFARTGGYLYLQYFQGYGESFHTYDQEVDAQVRIGFGIVR